MRRSITYLAILLCAVSSVSNATEGRSGGQRLSEHLREILTLNYNENLISSERLSSAFSDFPAEIEHIGPEDPIWDLADIGLLTHLSEEDPAGDFINALYVGVENYLEKVRDAIKTVAEENTGYSDSMLRALSILDEATGKYPTLFSPQDMTEINDTIRAHRQRALDAARDTVPALAETTAPSPRTPTKPRADIRRWLQMASQPTGNFGDIRPFDESHFTHRGQFKTGPRRLLMLGGSRESYGAILLGRVTRIGEGVGTKPEVHVADFDFARQVDSDLSEGIPRRVTRAVKEFRYSYHGLTPDLVVTFLNSTKIRSFEKKFHEAICFLPIEFMTAPRLRRSLTYLMSGGVFRSWQPLSRIANNRVYAILEELRLAGEIRNHNARDPRQAYPFTREPFLLTIEK